MIDPLYGSLEIIGRDGEIDLDDEDVGLLIECLDDEIDEYTDILAEIDAGGPGVRDAVAETLAEITRLRDAIHSVAVIAT